ncbi:tetratricopeptide repeat protein 19 homolog, mitochondrial-like isoform X2 [Gordionus sp. m RMFG-2023]|uniref:tetratricopeptide repeat protein 19 homolog, mitochondrial-like isoform X2 n=1 Tax=Gordionus sp. m RMFG-2023 TaxID=3053472 RepID=UPI0031FC0F43
MIQFTLNNIVIYNAMFLRHDKNNKTNDMIDLIKKGIYKQRLKKYNEAEDILHMALEIAINNNDEKTITYIYDILANNSFESKDFNKAEEVLKRISMMENNSHDTNAFVDVSLKLADIYFYKGDYTKAETGYKFCIGQLTTILSKESLVVISNNTSSQDEILNHDTIQLLGMCYHHYSKFILEHYNSFDYTTKAIEYLLKSIEIANSVIQSHIDFSSYHNDKIDNLLYKTDYFNIDNKNVFNPLVYTLHNDLAYAYEKINNMDVAMHELEYAISGIKDIRHIYSERLNQCIKSYEKQRLSAFILEMDEHLVTFYINLGMIFLNKSMPLESEKKCSLALKLATILKNGDLKHRSQHCLLLANPSFLA